MQGKEGMQGEGGGTGERRVGESRGRGMDWKKGEEGWGKGGVGGKGGRSKKLRHG